MHQDHPRECFIQLPPKLKILDGSLAIVVIGIIAMLFVAENQTTTCKYLDVIPIT